jgi:predicted RNase H-like HicB family nuclease
MKHSETTINAKQKDFTVLVEQDSEGYLVSTVVELAGCHTQARTLEELLARTKEAIELCLEDEPDTAEENTFVGLHRISVESHGHLHA